MGNNEVKKPTGSTPRPDGSRVITGGYKPRPGATNVKPTPPAADSSNK